MSWPIFFGIWAILILLICLFVRGASILNLNKGNDDDEQTAP